jgi:hypothetical protein
MRQSNVYMLMFYFCSILFCIVSGMKKIPIRGLIIINRIPLENTYLQQHHQQYSYQVVIRVDTRP